jgi:hypothetical protein
MCDLTFDESNGSQVEQVDELCVGKEIPVEKAIRKMANREVKPQEEYEEDCEMEETTISAPAANPEVSGEKSPEIPGFPETPEKTPKTPGLLLISPRTVKKMRT